MTAEDEIYDDEWANEQITALTEPVNLADLMRGTNDTTYPLLSERYGPDNPGTSEAEQNLFAAGALWQHDRTKRVIAGLKAELHRYESARCPEFMPLGSDRRCWLPLWHRGAHDANHPLGADQ
jgi:hypothetical protein